MLYIRIDVRHLCLASIAKFCDISNFEENVEEMVGTNRERQSLAGAATTGDKTPANGGLMYTDEGELEFDEDEMAVLEGQHLVAELFPNSGSEPDFEGFHVSEPAGNLSGCQQTVQMPPVSKPIQRRQTISPKMALTRPTNVSKEIINQLCILCCVLCVVYCVLCITVLCCANNQIQFFSTKFNLFFIKT